MILTCFGYELANRGCYCQKSMMPIPGFEFRWNRHCPGSEEVVYLQPSTANSVTSTSFTPRLVPSLLSKSQNSSKRTLPPNCPPQTRIANPSISIRHSRDLQHLHKANDEPRPSPARLNNITISNIATTCPPSTSLSTLDPPLPSNKTN